MVTKKQEKIKSIQIKFANEKVTSFGGLCLVERLAKSLGFWTGLNQSLPKRRGDYDWLTVIKSAVMGMISGSQGTYATEEIRNDEALLYMLGLSGSPEEATFWRTLEDLGGEKILPIINRKTRRAVVKIVRQTSRKELFVEGFLLLFGDGSLLEGSKNREGTKEIKGKGTGLLWNTLYVGPLIAGQQLAAEGEGEETCIRRILKEVVDEVLSPLQMKKDALLLLDSLHGDGPTCDIIEKLGIRYIIGANKLDETRRVLRDQPEMVWRELGDDPKRDMYQKAMCCCWIQCPEWTKKRILVGLRWKKKNDMFYEYAGLLTDVTEQRVENIIKRGMSYEEAIWYLYSRKSGMENYYKDMLEDLGLHHPPCQEHQRNAGYYALATMAYILCRGAEMIGGKGSGRGETKRKDGEERKHSTPRYMQIWRFIRRYVTLPGRISYHGREITVTILGLCDVIREEFLHYWCNICGC